MDYFCNVNIKIIIMALQEELEKEGNWLFKYRSYVPITLLVVGLGVYAATAIRSGQQVAEYWNGYEYVCLAVSLLGLAVRVITVGHTPKGTSGRNTEGQVCECLNTTGIYSLVRNPLYLGNFLMYFGIAMLTMSVWFVMAFMLLYWLYYERIIFAEEQFLRRKFGSAYLSWAARTPAFFPLITHFKPSTLPFSWKKVLKKEKNGVFALFLVFSIFDITGKWLGRTQSYNLFIASMAVATGIGYLILKMIKKHTNLLDEEGR